MIFPGIYASQISGHLFTLQGSYDALASVTVPSGGVSSVTFAGIPSTYSHLQIRYFAQTNRSLIIDDAFITINGDTTGANYYSHQLQGNGSSASAFSSAGNGGGGVGIFWPYAFSATASGSYNYWAGGVIDVLDYANTNKNKTLRSLSGSDTNGAAPSGYPAFVTLSSAAWFSTSAITSITIKSNGNFNQYSSFALYGVK
jgi:hypothetical protein